MQLAVRRQLSLGNDEKGETGKSMVNRSGCLAKPRAVYWRGKLFQSYHRETTVETEVRMACK